MTHQNARITPRISVVAPTGNDCAEISKLLGGDLDIRTEPGRLSRMNGTAVSLMRDSGIVLTRLVETEEEDIAALERLARTQDAKARLVVIGSADLPLSVTRRLSQAGVAEILPEPVAAEDLARTVERLARPAQVPALWTGRQPARILTVARARGGIGATTLAVNLADALAAKTGTFRKADGARVAIVDLDLQFGAVSSFLDLPARDTLYDIAAEQRMPDWAWIEDEMETAANGVKVLTAPKRFVPLDGLAGAQVGAILEALRDQFDYIVVDLPHSLVDWTQAVMDRSDKVLLVTDSTVPSIRQAKRLIDFLQEETPGLPVEVVVNLEARPVIKARHHAQAAKLLERPFNTWLPPDAKAARAALDRGVPLSEASRRSALTRSIAGLARTIQADGASVRPVH